MEGTIKHLGKSFCCSCLSSEEDSDLLLGEIFQSWRGNLYHKLFGGGRGIFLLLQVFRAFGGRRGGSEEDEEDGQEEQNYEEQQGRGILPEGRSRGLGHGGVGTLQLSVCLC